MTKYVVVIEHDGSSFGAYAPDLPGCVAVGDNADEVEQLMREAVPLHIASLKEHGEPVPEPRAAIRYLAG